MVYRINISKEQHLSNIKMFENSKAQTRRLGCIFLKRVLYCCCIAEVCFVQKSYKGYIEVETP